MSLRLEDRLKELAGLPALAPPDTLEERTLAAMAEAAAPRRTFTPAQAAAWIVAAGIGLVIGATAMHVGTSVDPGPASPPARTAGTPPASSSERASEPALEPASAATTATAQAAADELAYAELAAQAAYLEQLLVAMPQRSVMRVSTAGTIAGLEDQIAVIDAELGRAASPEYRTLLMHNRVQVMNALVNVRYLQSTAFAY